eukprot:1033952-Amphidinium_carterae.1
MALGAGALLLGSWVEAVQIAADLHPTSKVLEKLAAVPELLSSATQRSSSSPAASSSTKDANASAVEGRRLALLNWTEMEKESKQIVAHVEDKAGKAVGK